MANIETLLAGILSAVYGKDVRQSIHDAIKQCYDDVSNPDLNTEAFIKAIEEKIADGTLAQMTIPDEGVTTEKLADQAVTTEKLAGQAVTEDEIKDLAVTTEKIANKAITAEKMADGAFGTGAIAEGAVTGAKLAKGAVTAEKMQDGSVTAQKLVNGAVGEEKLADGAVSSGKMKDASVTSEKLAQGAVTTEKMQDGSVTAQKLANGSVGTEKMSPSFIERIKDNEKDVGALETTIKSLVDNMDLLIKSSKNYANGFKIGDDGKLYLTNDGTIVGNGIEIVAGSGSGGGLAFNSGYMSEDGYLHLTQDGTDIEGFDPIYIGSVGGGAAGSKLVFAMYTPAAFSVLQTNKKAPVKFRFTSVDATTQTPTGAGNLSIYVGGILKENRTIEQGDNIEIDIFEHLATGSNTVKLTMTDAYGATATRPITITVETFTLDWNLGATEKNSGPLTVYVTPTGSGTKMIYIMVDGMQHDMQVVTTTGRRITFNVPLSLGAHEIKCYGTMTMNGVTLTSDTLTCAVAQMQEGDNTVVIAANIPVTETTQYSTLAIPYRVIDPRNNPATVEFYVNGTLHATESVDQAEHIWSYRAITPGDITLAIKCGLEEFSRTITVSGLSTDISEVKDNLVLKIDPNDITDLKNFSYEGIGLTLSDNFDMQNGGLQTDTEGIRCIKVVKGDRLKINYNLFGVDARRDGRQFKFIYKVENSSNMDADAISCFSGNIGLAIKANSVLVKSEQSMLKDTTCEGIKTELDINIESDSDHRMMMMWEKGTPAKTAFYATNDNFRQNVPVGITVGSDDCDVIIYKVRVYSRDLTKEEIKANFYADGKDGEEITARYDRNQVYDGSGKLDPEKVATKNQGIHVFTWHAHNVSTAKSQKITGFMTHKLIVGGVRHTWNARNVLDKAQGTSSLGYVEAGCNEDFEFTEGFDLEDGTHIDLYSMRDNSIGVNYLNYKTNVASQEHVNNMMVSEWYNRHNPFVRLARMKNPKVRDTVESHMAVMFFHNTGTEAVKVGPMTVQPDETVFYSLGNLNNSKKNYEVFAQNDEDDVITVEVGNNISDQCRMKSDDLSGETWDGEANFEFRYISDTMDENEAKQLWQNLLTWVVSCDSTKATNKPFDQVITIDGQAFAADSPEYRIAKFRAEAGEHVVLDSVTFHLLMTLVFSQVDNRAKNTFWTYSLSLQKWHLNLAYDNDTAMGNDNEGGLTLKYGYMDYDKIGTRDVFNAADATMFVMMWKSFPEEVRDMYIRLENEGAFDLDAFAELCEQQQDLACESLWIEDAWRKDIDTYIVNGTSAYVPMQNGKKRLQRRNFLHFQRAFMSSYFIDSYATSESATIRGYTPDGNLAVPPQSKMSITPYSDLWVTVKAGSGTVQKRAKAGEVVELKLGVSQMNDTEIYVRNAGFIQDLGDIACLYPGYIDIAPCTKLKRAQIGSSIEEYVNTNMKELTVKNAKSLEYINVENCPNLLQELDLSNNVNVKECYTRGSGVTGVSFADHGRIVKALLNAVSSIFARNLWYLQEFTMQGYDSLTTLNVVGSPSLDTLDIATKAVNLNRVRLIDIDWRTNVKAYHTLMRLHQANGIDDDGHNTDYGVLTGSVFFDAISQTKYQSLVSSIPEVHFTYGEFMEEHTVTFTNYDGTILHVQKVEHGGTAEDPIEYGYIGVPTKAPDDDYVYTFFKWDKPIENIIDDTILKAEFTQSVRQNVVRFINDGIVVETHNVPAHGSCIYEGDDLSKSGYVWIGWDKVAENVIADMDINAVYIYPRLPSTVKDLTKYDYAYSDDPADNAAYTFGELYSIFKMGRAVDYGFGPAVLIKMIARKAREKGIITDTSIVFRYHSKGHYALSDGSGMSNGDFYMVGVLTQNRQMNPTNTNVGGWDACRNREWLNKTLYPALEPQWRNFIALSDTLANAGGQSSDIITSQDYLRIPSTSEMGFDINSVPYKNEVSPDAGEIAFSCYTTNESRIKRQFNGEGTAQNYWLRSADAGGSAAFRGINGNGISFTGNANSSYGECVGFSV